MTQTLHPDLLTTDGFTSTTVSDVASNNGVTTDSTGNDYLNCAFPSTGGSDLATGAASQSFTIVAAKTSGSGTNDVTYQVDLYQNGALVATLGTKVLTSTANSTDTFTWNGSSYTGTANGAQVEVRITQTDGASGNPSKRAYLAIDEVYWTADSNQRISPEGIDLKTVQGIDLTNATLDATHDAESGDLTGVTTETGTPTASSVNAHAGTYSYLCEGDPTTRDEFSVSLNSGGSGTKTSIEFWALWNNGIPSTSGWLWCEDGAGLDRWYLRAEGTTGGFTLHNKSGTVAGVFLVSLTNGAWYKFRIYYAVDATDGEWRLEIYNSSDTLLYEFGLSTLDSFNTSTTQKLRFMGAGGTGTNVYQDDIKLYTGGDYQDSIPFGTATVSESSGASTLTAETGSFQIGAETQETGYFDSSDAAIVDALGNWLNDSWAFDGDTGTFAEVMASSGSLYGQGTNLADLGGPISLVEFRGYGGTDAETSGLSFRAYHDGGGPFKGDVSRNGATGTGWTAWGTITAPAGGWTWPDVQALEVNIALGGLGLSYTSAHAVDVRVTYIGDDLADLKYNRVLKAETGSFALTGQTVDLVLGFNLPAVPGSLTLTGSNVAFKLGHVLTVDAGAFNLAGVASDLDLTRRMALDAGSFTLTGIEATLAKSKNFQASSGSFALSGIDATLAATRAISAETGVIVSTGQDAAFKRALVVRFDTGTFTQTGQAANLNRGLVLGTETGAFTLTGQAALFKRGLVAAFDAGSFALVGVDATLTSQGISEMPASPGAFTLAGQDAAFQRNVRLSANTATFTLTGVDANLTAAGITELAAEPGSFVVSGIQANLVLSAKLKANTGSFTLAGTDLGFAHDRALKAGIGAFSYVGQATNLVRSVKLDAGTGGFTWTGIDADLDYYLVSTGAINSRTTVVIPDLAQSVIIADAANQVIIQDQAIAATILDLATEVIVQDAKTQVIIQDAKTTVEL